jgi:electron transport complex protein RnfE
LNLNPLRKLFKQTKPINGIFESNPVLRFGLALPFAVAGAISLRSAAMLIIAVFATVLPISLIAYLVGDKIPKHIRIAVYPVIAMFILLPIRYYIYKWNPVVADNLGMYIYLMAMSSLLISQIEHSSMRKRSLLQSMVKSLSTCIGFALVIGVMGAIREMLGYGTLWGHVLPFENISLYGVTYTFFGFILMGFIMALAKAIRRAFNGYVVGSATKEN